jgi:hypothetical protein
MTHTVKIIQHQGSKIVKVFESSGQNEDELLTQAKKFITGEELKRATTLFVSTKPKSIRGMKIYNVFDDNAMTSFGQSSLGQRTITAYNIIIDDPDDLKALEQKRINAGFHAGF